MIKSMTGYGRATGSFDGMDITLELKSVNHRYFEFSSRVPRNFGFLDEKLKSFFQGKISRGKVECYVQIDTAGEESAVVKLNSALAKGYLAAYKELSETCGIENDIKVSDLARVSDIFTVSKEPEDEEKICADVLSVAAEALERFIAMRAVEGGKLKDDVTSRLDFIIDKVAFIEERSPQTVKEYNEKLLTRMREVLGDVHVDEQRLLTEAAIYADKVAVAEETVRLRSHIDQFKKLFEEDGGAIGRKMDFLVQEINREINTIGSKAQDIEIARCVVDVKAEIEKIREQIQKLINIGFGNMVNANRLVAIVSPESAPIKRIIQDCKERGTLIDATHGRRTRAVIITDSDHVILTYLQSETVANRLNNDGDELDIEEEESDE